MERKPIFTDDPMGAMPVFMREFRSRMRRPYAYWLLLGYLALLIPPSLYFLYHTATLQRAAGEQEMLTLVRQGGVAFTLVLFAVQFLLITALAPALSCASFAAERAKRRLLFLLITPLSSRHIVQGKLLFILYYQGLLLLATMPLCAIAGMFGGLSPFDVLAGYALLAMYAVALGAGGLFISAKVARTERAALWTYLGVLALFLCIPWLALPFLGLASLAMTGEATAFTAVANVLPIPVVALPGVFLFWLIAKWLLNETCALLDNERRQWGTYAPPLPLQRSDTGSPATRVYSQTAAITSEERLHERRW